MEGIVSGGGFDGTFLLPVLAGLAAGTGAVQRQRALFAVRSGASAGAVPISVSIALNSEQKSTSGFCCWWVTLSKSPLNASGGAVCWGGLRGRREGSSFQQRCKRGPVFHLP